MRDERGFTLIELLTVMVMMGVIAAIGLPRFGSARDKAYRAQMQTDLRAVVIAQESYFEETFTYATDVSALNFNPAAGVTIKVLETSGNGWSAGATHASSPTRCAIYIGSVSPPGDVPVPDEGIIGCTT